MKSMSHPRALAPRLVYVGRAKGVFIRVQAWPTIAFGSSAQSLIAQVCPTYDSAYALPSQLVDTGAKWSL